MSKVVVAGGGGYIGTRLCGILLEEGYEVACLDHCYFGTHGLEAMLGHERFELCRKNIRDSGEQVLEGADALMILAGISNDPASDLNPQLTEDINVRGTVALAQLAKKYRVPRCVFSSSCSVYGTGAGHYLTEESPLNPVSLYAKSKRDAEKHLEEMASDDFCVTSLRNATAFGVSTRMRFDLLVNIMTAHAALNGKVFVLGGGKQWRPNVHIADIARAFIAVLRADQGVVNREVFNVGSNELNCQVIGVAGMIREVLPHTEIEIVPDDQDKRDYHVDFSKIHDVLDYSASVSIQDGIREVWKAIERGEVDYDDIRSSTVKYYKYLIQAEEVLNDVKLDGRLF